jgi:anti-sigma factor RsiW
MKTFEEKYTAWVDGKLSAEERLEFEATLGEDAGGDKESILMMGTFLRGHAAPPPLANGDFFNHQLLERIAAETKALSPARRTTSWFVPRFIWAGASSLAGAALLFHFLIPVGPQANPPSSTEYTAQFYNARSVDPAVSATAFHSKKDNVTVLWLDGLNYLPETADLK